MNQEQWRQKSYNEWVGRTTGARSNLDQASGDDARRAAEASRRAWDSTTYAPTNHSSGGVTSGGWTNRPRVGRQSAPWFPFIDRWLTSIPRWIPLALGVVGAFIGYGYALEIGVEANSVGYAVLGGLAGLVVLPLAAVALKIVLAAIVFGVVALLLYVLMTAFTG